MRSHPSFAHDHAKKRCLPEKGKRSAERRIVLTNVRVTTRRAHCFFQRAHLSALTLAALATGFYPDGSAPEPGFPQAAAKRLFLPLRQQRCRG